MLVQQLYEATVESRRTVTKCYRRKDKHPEYPEAMGSARDSGHRVGEIKVSLCHLPSGLKVQSSEMTTTTVEPIMLATHGETRVRRLSERESRVSDLLRSVQSLENDLPTHAG